MLELRNVLNTQKYCLKIEVEKALKNAFLTPVIPKPGLKKILERFIFARKRRPPRQHFPKKSFGGGGAKGRGPKHLSSHLLARYSSVCPWAYTGIPWIYKPSKHIEKLTST
jgi:hypothetical protein